MCFKPTSSKMQLRDTVLHWFPRYHPCTARSALRSPTSAAKRTNWAGVRWNWASCRRRRLSWSRVCSLVVSSWTASLSHSKLPRKRSTRSGCTGHLGFLSLLTSSQCSLSKQCCKTSVSHKGTWKNMHVYSNSAIKMWYFNILNMI